MGGGCRVWTFRGEQVLSSSCSISSSSTGTVSSSGSRLSSLAMEAAAINLDLEFDIQKREQFICALSANCGDNTSILKKWFEYMGVGWVLHIADDASAATLEHTSAAVSWIRALVEIMQTIRSTASMVPPGLSNLCMEEQDFKAESSIPVPVKPDPFKFAWNIQETMSKMLVLVDVLVSMDPNIAREAFIDKYSKKYFFVANSVPAYRKINVLLRVHDALSDALSQMKVSFLWTSSGQVAMIRAKMVSLLYAKDVMAREAIWSTLEEIRTCIQVQSNDRSPGTQDPEGFPDIHPVNWSVMGHITFLVDNYSSLYQIVWDPASIGEYVPQIADLSPLDSMIMEMTSFLEQQIVYISDSFLDQGLRFLFLLNNSQFIRQQRFEVATDLTLKFDNYMKSYLQVSWEPLLSSLVTPIPLCFWRDHPKLSKFEWEFHNIYTTQKLWKVPDPDLRKILREAIANKVIPVYTKFLEDNSITTTRVNPQELEQMLQDLFEG